MPARCRSALGPGLGKFTCGTVEARTVAQTRRLALYPTDLREIPRTGSSAAAAQRPGVTEINTIGGFAKEFQVPPPAREAGCLAGLQRHGRRIRTANNGNVGAGYIEKRGEQYLIRAWASASLADIGNVILSSRRRPDPRS